MIKPTLRDERGVAMVVEVLLVALVLSFVGLAIWQANQHSKKAENATAVQTPAVAAGVDTAAEAAAKVVDEDQSSDITISAEAESAEGVEFDAVANDAANLEASFNDSDL
jgi:cytochrome oxidase assembly protein ShyY1